MRLGEAVLSSEESADVYRDVTRATSTPIHTGEQIYLRQNFKELIETHAVNIIGHDPEVIAKMSSWDATIYETKDVTPAALRETMSSNVAMWTQLIQGAGLTPQ